MRRVHLCISGDVQGVGFRAWACGQARERGLTGWVKNKDDVKGW
ncbi:acylphosphatase [Candidatus Gottesmanbacteria bacterium]|nr:acylphosphatase [Candidatus Gottesmanbacteria bacterium]